MSEVLEGTILNAADPAVEVTRIEITDAEKLAVVKLENDFLKNQMELSQLVKRHEQLQENAKKLTDGFNAKVKELTTKYVVDEKYFQFNMLEQAFTKR